MRIARLLTGTLAVGWLALWTLHFARSHYFTIATTLQDDSFYYLLPAWNVSRLGWFTFDGLTPCYGFQPLWELCLSALALVMPSREAFLRASLVLAALCYALTALSAARVSALASQRTGHSGGAWAALVTAAVLLGNIPVQTSNLTGKENAL